VFYFWRITFVVVLVIVVVVAAVTTMRVHFVVVSHYLTITLKTNPKPNPKL